MLHNKTVKLAENIWNKETEYALTMDAVTRLE